jgi:hypothetical protein
MSSRDEEERAADGLLRAHGGFGKGKGYYRESDLADQWPRAVSLEDLAIDEAVVANESPAAVGLSGSAAWLSRCLECAGLSEGENDVVSAMITLYADSDKRPVFRAVAREAGCSVRWAWVQWNGAASKLVCWAESHPNVSSPGEGRNMMIQILVEVFGSYAVRLAGYRL